VDVAVKDGDGAAVGYQQGGEQANERRLARAVSAQHAKDLTPLNAQGDLIDSLDLLAAVPVAVVLPGRPGPGSLAALVKALANFFHQ
jgi:hypothetical protein